MMMYLLWVAKMSSPRSNVISVSVAEMVLKLRPTAKRETAAETGRFNTLFMIDIPLQKAMMQNTHQYAIAINL